MKATFYTPETMLPEHWRILGYSVNSEDHNENGMPSEDYIERHAHSLWESDPDYVRADGYQICFREIDREQGLWLVSEEDAECIDILNRWLNHEGDNSLYPKCDLDKCDNAVAYRGGKGYVYSITIF